MNILLIIVIVIAVILAITGGLVQSLQFLPVGRARPPRDRRDRLVDPSDQRQPQGLTTPHV